MPNLTRVEQDNILVPIVFAACMVSTELGDDPAAPEHTIAAYRAALRLDDKSLDLAIAYGAHRNPWRSVGHRIIDV